MCTRTMRAASPKTGGQLRLYMHVERLPGTYSNILPTGYTLAMS